MLVCCGGIIWQAKRVKDRSGKPGPHPLPLSGGEGCEAEKKYLGGLAVDSLAAGNAQRMIMIICVHPLLRSIFRSFAAIDPS